jgi:hypothetical protein
MYVVFVESNGLNNIAGDVIKFSNLAILSFGNGYLQTICCVIAPKKVPKDKQEFLGMMVGITLNLGILIGAAAQLPLQML